MILTNHGCDRIQPVAMVHGHTPTLNDYWCGIARLLKKETSLVYIIWSGSLESVNGTHHPPIKKIVQSLANRPLRTNLQNSTSVMHRLVFLQLGSKGEVECLVSNLNSIYVFWALSADDADFDAKKCGEHVYKEVKDKLEWLKKNRSKSKHIGENQVDSKSSAACPTTSLTEENPLSPYTNHSQLDANRKDTLPTKFETMSEASSLIKQLQKDMFEKMDKDKKETIGHIDTVGGQVDNLDAKLTESQVEAEQ